ncbi:MAG TPA: HAMP domain-containing sensor histidine kinase [Pyrinomonadaceae bacterium]|jgi:signal transduction histidine kinase
MSPKKRKLLGSFNRYKLILTLGGPIRFALALLAVLLPAAGLIYVNYSQLQIFERDKVLEAALHRDFMEILAITEKRMNKKAYAMVDDTRSLFPECDCDQIEKEKKLDRILEKNPWIASVLYYDDKGLIVQSQPSKMEDKYFHEDHEKMFESYRGWFKMEGKDLLEGMHKKSRPMNFYGGPAQRSYGETYVFSALFPIPRAPFGKVVLGGLVFDDVYLKNTFFPEMLKEAMEDKYTEQGGNRIVMSVIPAESDGSYPMKPLVASAGWNEGKPEVVHKFEDVFRPLALGIKYQDISVRELGETWVHRSFLILGILSLMIIGGLVLTKHMVGKEMALAKLKSDFVSNVSHELRTPLALIRLYAETLELGRISTQEKKHQYYRIIRKESERLTALINNILDFSRIEAGHKEYEFRETDIAELVRNTLDSYRYQIEQQGFELDERIDSNLPPLQVDREAIARALVNLINNALKYSSDDKFLGVKLYRENGVVKLEVLDHGIGIDRHDQSKIFEKFYRAGDPLVHNTKGSGLGLSLVRHISQAHGGDIEVQSVPGRGSKFILSLPVKEAVETAPHQFAEGTMAS